MTFTLLFGLLQVKLTIYQPFFFSHYKKFEYTSKLFFFILFSIQIKKNKIIILLSIQIKEQN